MPSFAWSTNLATPAALTGLVITPDTGNAALVATVTASVDPYHEDYVWGATNEDGEWVEIDRTTDPILVWMLAPSNIEQRIRVRDSNGTLLAEAIEATGTSVVRHWWQVDSEGPEGDGSDFIRELPKVFLGGTTEIPIDQTILQPLSGADGEEQLPIVITGQFQGERVSLELHVDADERDLLRLLKRAARERRGYIAWKDPKGPVYLVAVGGQRRSDIGGGQERVTVQAIRIA